MDLEKDPPDGYFIAHNRMTDTLYFGPFKSIEEADAFAAANKIGCNLHAMYLNVDWNRR